LRAIISPSHEPSESRTRLRYRALLRGKVAEQACGEKGSKVELRTQPTACCSKQQKEGGGKRCPSGKGTKLSAQ